MRFIIAIIFVCLNSFLMLASSSGFSSRANMLSTIFGFAILAPTFIAAIFCIQKKYRNDKHFFKIFNIISFIVILTSAANFIETLSAPPKTLKDQHGIINITVPGSWVSNKPNNENILLNINDKKDVISIIVSAETTNNRNENVSEYAKFIVDQLSKNEAFVSSSLTNTCVNLNYKCVFNEIEMSNGEKGTTILIVTLKSNSNYYVFYGTTSTPLYKDQKPKFFEILNTLKEI